MPIYKIPLTPVPQIFNIVLDGVHYTLNLHWNDAEISGKTWIIDILDADTREPILNGIPLVTGCNLLEQYGYLGFNDVLEAYTDGSLEPPSFDNLGSDGNLYFITNFEEYANGAA
jgi:hypothetical protein